jgi:phosphopantetheinyl transferase
MAASDQPEPIHIGLSDCSAGDPDLAEREACLFPDEIERAGRLRRPLSRRCLVEGRRLARIMLSRLAGADPATLAFAIDEEGKPWIPALPGWHFNISHSGSLVACAVARIPVGLDLEHQRPGKDRGEVAERFFSPAECTEIRAAADPGERFYQYWSLKEAWLKWRGWGLRGLSRVPEFAFLKDGSIAPLGPTPDGDGGGAGLAVWRFGLPGIPGAWTLAAAAAAPWSPLADQRFRLDPPPPPLSLHCSPGVGGGIPLA